LSKGTGKGGEKGAAFKKAPKRAAAYKKEKKKNLGKKRGVEGGRRRGPEKDFQDRKKKPKPTIWEREKAEAHDEEK